MYLLDTNVVPELRKAGTGRADPAVLRWAASIGSALLHISVITIMEIEIGIPRLARRDRDQAELLRRRLKQRGLTAFAGRILPVNGDISSKAATVT